MPLTYSSIPGLVLAQNRAKSSSDNQPPTSPAEAVGTLANRPLATTVTAGTKYFATDALADLGGVQYISNGASWLPLNNAAAGLWLPYATSGPANSASTSLTASGIYNGNTKIDTATGAAFTSLFYIPQADFPSGSYEFKLSCFLETREGTAIGAVNLTPGLYPVVAGNTSANNAVNLKIGAVSQVTPVIASPAAGAQVGPIESAANFSAPASGIYTMAIAIDAALAANTAYVARLVLFVRTKVAPA